MAHEICIKLGRKLRDLREKKSLTQEALAEQSGISTKYLQNLEGKNPKVASLVTIAKLAKAFKIPPSKLIDF